jgi:uncharacterized protein
MNPANPNSSRPLLEVRGARASSVIVQRIPPKSEEAFMQWERGITSAAAEFPGYQSTEIYPPLGHQDEWVSIVHFDNQKTLQDWVDSAKRAEWIAKLPCETRDFQLKMLPSGFSPWFAGLAEDGGHLPHWKMALAVLFGLYPTAMLLTLFLWPHMNRFGPAFALLISNTCSVSFLEWWGMPVINRLLGPWLRANGKDGRVLSLVGLVLIVGALGLMAFLFHLLTPQP